MKRRNALKMVATAVGGMIALPGWASGWSAESLQLADASRRLLSTAETSLLAEICEVIIPVTTSTDAAKTEIPGAKALNVDRFIEKMLTDCYDEQAQQTFRKGLSSVDEVAQATIGKPFLEGDGAQRLAILTRLQQSADATQKSFLSLVKSLTIRGYMNSEYVMTNITHYEMVPGRYKGCVPVSQ